MGDKHTNEPRSVAFRKEREATWRALEVLVDQTQRRGLGSLSQEDLQQLPVLYRETVFSLSVARTTALDSSLIKYLEALCARAYLTVYGSRRPIRDLWQTLFVAVPIAIRRIWIEFWISFAVFALGVGVAWTLTAQNPSWYNSFVPSRMASGRTPWASTEKLRETLYSQPKMKEMLGVFASYLFSHNTRIGIMAFCLGFFLGLPTILLLFYNGLVLGAFLAVFDQHGLLYEVLGWLLPHGVPEIGAILLCGAAGISLGRALFFPGRHKRSDSLRKIGPQAAMVVAGCFFLFFIAALTEGFFRQLVHDDILRYAMATLQLIWLTSWIMWAGRKKGEDHERILHELGAKA